MAMGDAVAIKKTTGTARYVTARDLNFVVAGNSKYAVAAGAPVEPSKDTGPGYFGWVKPSHFPSGSMAHHDATHYGFRVQPGDVTTLSEGAT